MPAKGQKISEEHRAALRAWHRGQKTGQSPSKRCPKCGETKPRSDFGLRGANPQGKRYTKSYCKPCENIISTTKARQNPEKVAAWNRRTALQRYFDMTEDEFAELNDIQNGICAICDEAPVDDSTRLNIDHDHDSGVVRGLLCRGCNQGLGSFRDSPELLRRAIDYLAKDPIALNDGTTFAAVPEEHLKRRGAPRTAPDEDMILIAEQFKHLRGGRSKASVARAIGTATAQITHLENTATSKGDLEVMFNLAHHYGMELAITESFRIVMLHPESATESA